MFLFILSTLLACSNMFVNPLISIILNLSKESCLERQLRVDILDLKKQLQTVNMVDQFPAYAKLQRKINALTTCYKEKTNERKATVQKLKLFLKIFFEGLIVVCSIILIWNYRSYPVVSLPARLLSPLDSILSMPSCQPGEISLMAWLPLARTAIGRFLKIIYK